MVVRKKQNKNFVISHSIKDPKGFSLVEILVVVGIIGILAAIGIPAILNAQRSARDAARAAALEPVRAAMKDLSVKFPGNRTKICFDAGQTKVFITTDPSPSPTCGASNRKAERLVPIPGGYAATAVGECSASNASIANTIKYVNDRTNSKLIYCKENGTTQDLPY